MRFRLRGPDGVSTVSLADDATVGDLRNSITQNTSLNSYDIKSGFPSKIVDLEHFDDKVLLKDTDLKLNGEQLIVESKAQVVSQPKEEATSATVTSKEPLREPAQPLSLQRKETNLDDPPEIPLPSHNGVLVLRIMPDDNSCLFRALGSAVLGDSLDAMTELRSLVATQIQNQPEAYSEAILGKPPNTYCRWIQREDSWGGGVELAILSQQFDIEICSIDVQSLRVDRFNEGRPTRCILVYSGIHYDVLALTPSPEVPAEFDTKIFEADDEAILVAAVQLCQRLQEKHYFTDTAGFDIKCNVCGWTGNGEKGAVKHAEETGHMNFGEAS